MIIFYLSVSRPESYKTIVKRTKNFKTRHIIFSVFAIFFPAVTGIFAGANLSGDLRDPAESIPKGTLLSILITGLSYTYIVVLSTGCSLKNASGNRS